MDQHDDLRAVVDAPVVEPPWYFRLGRFLSRRNIRGGVRLIEEARKRGLLDRLAVYSLNGVPLRVPLWRPCNAWDEVDVMAYEERLVAALARAVRALPRGGVTLVDCGADIGTITAHLVSRCPNISSVAAFEPNPVAYQVLVDNLRALPIAAVAHHAAVGNFRGTGSLVSPQADPSAHAMFIERDPEGSIDVRRIDDLELPAGQSCVIKIDVEGTEAAVVEGALRTLRAARAAVVAFEAHPRVSRRTGEDPVTVMRALQATRPDFTFAVDTRPVRALSADRPLFEQLPADRVYNVIASSRGA